MCTQCFFVRGICVLSASNSAPITAVFRLPFLVMEILRVSIYPAKFFHLDFKTAPKNDHVNS